MIIKTSLVPSGFDAVTVFPFIFIRPEKATNTALIAHELVHYQEQKSAWVIPWLLRYALSRKFRFCAEIRGYRAQIASGGITVDEAIRMLGQYGFELSDDQYREQLAHVERQSSTPCVFAERRT